LEGQAVKGCLEQIPAASAKKATGQYRKTRSQLMKLAAEPGEDDYFGFGVDAGMGCIADVQTREVFQAYWAKRLEEDPDIDPYNDLFCDLLEENAKARPKYQEKYGDRLNWTLSDTDCDLPMFHSSWGDGYYPIYFGYDAKGEVCAVYVRFIDIEDSYQEQA